MANHFNADRDLTSRAVFKKNRAGALAEWRQLGAGQGTGVLTWWGLVLIGLTAPRRHPDVN
jgi:hypothetical protein